MKILVIEDDADIASNIGQYFEAKGHELDFAYSGAHGLKLAIDERFDLIILDLMLPGKDGITVCREFREQSKHDTPILMLTARYHRRQDIRFRGGHRRLPAPRPASCLPWRCCKARTPRPSSTARRSSTGATASRIQATRILC